MEATVLLNRTVVSISDIFDGSVNYWDIFTRRTAIHNALVTKKSGASNIIDIGNFRTVCLNQWATLLDKGYQGCA